MSHRKVTLFFTSFLLGVICFAGEDWQPQPIGPFAGLNNRDNSFAIANQNAQDLLNVNITAGGKSVFKRKGYGQAFALTITTSPVHGIYTFFDGSGNSVDLFANDTYLTGSVNGGTPSVIFSTGPNGATYQCTDNLGSAYCANSQRTTLIKTNGVSYSQILNVASTGTMVAACATRLAQSGFSDRPSGIDFSADSDFTTWGTGSLGTSPVQLTVSAPGARITHVTYAFNRLIWFKDTSFGYVLIGNQPFQTDWVIQTVAYDVGTNDNSSVFREGILYFRGQDGHIYAFNGSSYQRASREIAGTIALSQRKSSNSWLQTTQADFQAGAQSPVNWISTAIIPGSVILSTQSASSFINSVSTDFAAGTLVGVSTRTPNFVTLGFNPDSGGVPATNGTDSCATSCSGAYSQSVFLLNNITSIASSFYMRLWKTGAPGDYNFNLRLANGDGSLGAILQTVVVPASSISSATSTIKIDLSSATVLTAGTSYWLQLVPVGACSDSAGNYIRIAIFDFVSSNQNFFGCGGSNLSIGQRYNISLATTSYVSSGTFTSEIFDVGFTNSNWVPLWGVLNATATIPATTTITYAIQTSSSATGVFTSTSGVISGGKISAPSQEFIRYYANFNTLSPSTSPILNSVSISFGLLRPGATFFSQIKNAPSLTTWDTFQGDAPNNGGTNNFSIRSSTNIFSVLSATPSWSPIIFGAVPTVSTGTYFQIKDQLNISTSSVLINYGPELDDFTQNWFEGIASDKAYATYFDDKIWFEVTAGTGATTNNRTLVYDILNQTWTLYDLAVNGFYVRQNTLFLGSSTGGYIYKFGTQDNDNGNAINAYWKSKDFYGGSPFGTQELANISFANKTVQNSSMTVTYTLNGTNSGSFIFPTSSSNNNFIGKNKNIPAGTTCSTYNVQFGNNAADQPFEVFGIQVGIRPKSWIPN